MNSKAALISVIVVAVGAAFAVHYMPSSPVTVKGDGVAAATPSLQLPTAQETVSKALPTAVVASAPSSALVSLTAQGAYERYSRLHACAEKRAFDARISQVPSESRAGMQAAARGMEKACDGITDQQLAERLTLLRQAVDAGVPGAISKWIQEGPFGDPTALESRPDDPLVVEWKKEAVEKLKQGADAGSRSALAMSAQLFESDGLLTSRDVPSAIKYWTALGELSDKPATNKNAQTIVRGLSSQVPAEVARKAISEGQDLVKKCCELGKSGPQ